MVTIDWPSDRAFYPADFQVGPDVPQSAWRGIYTGTRNTYVHAADRLAAVLTLPPCKAADAAARESFIGALLSTGDTVRMPMWHRRYVRGTANGSPTVNGAVAAGARQLEMASVRGENLVFNGSFEVDTNADGVANSWTANQAGSVSSVVYSRPTGSAESGTYEQQITWTQGATGIANRVGIEQLVVVPAGLSQVTAAVQARSGSGGLVRTVLYCEFRDSGLSIIGTDTAVDVAVSTTARIGGTVAVPVGTESITFHLWAYATATGAMSVAWDVAMLKQGATDLVTVPGGTLLGGDFIGIGGNILQVTHAGASANDTGGVIVPLVYPVQKAISNGAAVTLSAPTGVWQLDTTGLRFSYVAGVIQDGIALQFRQVIV